MIFCYFFWQKLTCSPIPGGRNIFPQLRHCNGFEENVVYINIGCREQGTRLIVLLCFYLAATKLEPRYGVATAVGEVCLYIPYHNIVNLDSVNYYTKKTEAGLWNEDGCVQEQWL